MTNPTRARPTAEEIANEIADRLWRSKPAPGETRMVEHALATADAYWAPQVEELQRELDEVDVELACSRENNDALHAKYAALVAMASNVVALYSDLQVRRHIDAMLNAIDALAAALREVEK